MNKPTQTYKQKTMNIEIRHSFNKYIESHKQLKYLFDDLDEENGIALQYFFENFARIVLEQSQEEHSIKQTKT